MRVLHSYSNHVIAAQRLERTIRSAEKGGRRPRTAPLPKPAKQKTIDEIEHMVNLWHQCGNILEIARTMKVHDSTVRNHLRDAGIDTTPRVLNDDDLAKIRQLKTDGHSYRQIAHKTGWSLSSVGKALRTR
ncbi:hypothetical protein [Gordonia sp. RS15-1S]|uniref:hypothetical protein n=1 Tax=Gordonia oryzae TaxID=2487349 RepID=UPI0011CDE2EC